MPNASPTWRQGIVCLLILLVDILSKYWVFSSVYRDIPVFSHFLGGIDFSISRVANHGAAWGMLATYQVPLLLFRCLAVAVLAIYIFKFNPHSSRRLPLLLILTGAIGNVLDFFIYGYVVDMFLFYFWGHPFAVFNIADSAITIGVACLIVLSFCSSKESAQAV